MATMFSYLAVQDTASSTGHVLHFKYDLSQGTSASPLAMFNELGFERVVRTTIYGVAIFIPFLFLLLQRVITGIPFFSYKDYRSYAIVNKKQFLTFYDFDELPSKAPIEELSGIRLKIAWAQELCLLGLVAVSCKVLVSRLTRSIDFIEEAFELAYWVFFLVLFTFRFYPTPYRPTIFTLVSLASITLLILLCERDLWPKLLLFPSQERLQQSRTGWEVYTRLSLSLILGSLSLLTPSVWYPVDPYSDNVASLEQTMSIFGYMISYSWIESLIRKGFGNELEIEDLPKLSDYDCAKLWSTKILKTKKSSTFWTLLSLMRYDLLYITLCNFLCAILSFVNPLCMRQILAYIEKSSDPTITPWVYVGGLFFGPLFSAVITGTKSLTNSRLMLRIKAGLAQIILKKTLNIRITDFETVKKDDKKVKRDETDNTDVVQPAIGKITFLMNSDVERLIGASSFLTLMASAPIQIIFAVMLLYDLLGWASFVGEALMVVTMVIPAIMSKYYIELLKRQRKAVEARFGLTTETLGAIRIVKFFGMERIFLARIHQKREAELRINAMTSLFGIVYSIVQYIMPTTSMLITFGIYAKLMGKPLNPSVLFTSMSVFSILESQFGSVTSTLQTVIDSFVSFDRIDKFLAGEELQAVEGTEQAIELAEVAPSYKNATLSWALPGSNTDNNFRLSDLNVECVYGGLTVISGPVGSGKSSFLLGLLGEMRLLKGSLYLPRNRGIAYVAQTTWLQNKTIRDNILFGELYEGKRYKAVLEACDLSTDLSKYEDGDLTEVGEKGVTLSGGQKARLSLARAVYSPAQTVLLDDVLSALDAATIKVIFDKCINGEVLAGRTVVLVTHHVSLVSSSAKKIVVLEDGKVISDGLPRILSASAIKIINDTDDSGRLGQELDASLLEGQSDDGNKSIPEMDRKPSSKLVEDEDRTKGKVPMILIWEYAKHLGTPFVLIFLVIMSMMMELVLLGSSLFLAAWSDQYSKPGKVDVNWWLGLYSVVVLGILVCFFITHGSWYLFLLVAARRLHERLMKSVLYSPIRFFDTTPLGRIIQRFSSDIYSIDWTLGGGLRSLVSGILGIIFKFTVMFGLIPTFLAPCLVAVLIGVVCREFYVRSKISVNRLYSIQSSPVFSHLNDTVSGIVTIRAFTCQQRFLDENLKKIDDANQVSWALTGLNSWMDIRSTACSAVISAATGFMALKMTGYSAGLIGFSINNCLSFSSAVLSVVSGFNKMQVELNSFDRINRYINLEQEKPSTPENEPPAAWPTQGDIKVVNLSVKYSANGPEVLSNISFDVKSRERVGIVGRTGAGKSSLALSLLRFTEISKGSITINGVDITKVNLEALRQRITIIPQDPIMFSGTVRDNLDPYHEFDDTELQVALEGSGLAGITEDRNDSNTDSSSLLATPSTVEGTLEETMLRTKQIGLDSLVTTGGDNLSQGQRQLLAFARALIRRSKLVILDEATSSTDMNMDERIQETLRTSFPGSTIITIAHRLRTVMSFDRIIALDNLGKGGEVVECDTPFNLLQRPNGALYNLARKSGEFEGLLELAIKGKAMQENGK